MSHARFRVIASFIFAVLLLLPLSVAARAMEFSDLLKIKRIDSPVVSPDGKLVAFAVKNYNPETLVSWTDICLVGSDGGEVKTLTKVTSANDNPIFTPDSKYLLFASRRTGTRQFFKRSLTGGTEVVQLTNFPGGVSGGKISSDGRYLLFYASTFVDSGSVVGYDPLGSSQPNARIIDKLLFRHWDHWRNGRYDHVYIKDLRTDSEPVDLTPGQVDSPPVSLGSRSDYAMDKSGKYVYYVANRDPVIAISTNNDIWRVPATGGTFEKITSSLANDNQIKFSPDGKYMAYRAMARPGFEADRYCLMLREMLNGETVNLSDALDRSVGQIIWSPDGKYLYFQAEDEGYLHLYRVKAGMTKGGEIEKIWDAGNISDISITPDGKRIIALMDSFNKPAEIVSIPVKAGSGKIKHLTDFNSEIISEIDFEEAEEFTFKAEDGVDVHGFLIPPPGYGPSKKYPFVYLIHGGPQGAWINEFHYRWNPQMWASWGYVVAMVNPRGSTGYGQKFTDQISGDWGGKCYRDLMLGVDYLLENYDFIDQDRMGAAGASFGGYMVHWIEGHNKRFKTLVCHDGVYNLESMYGSTEELWFPEWELGGPPWVNPTLYRKFSPHLFVENFSTPMLIIHGELDFRVPPEQAFAAYTSLQRVGLESRLLYFPGEGHWVQDPANLRLWHETIRDWLDRYLKD